MLFFPCQKSEFPAIDGRCRQIHLTDATLSRVQSLHRSHNTNACVHWLKGLRAPDELCAKNIHSSTRHVSPCASQYTEHQHKFSLFYLSCVTVVPLLPTHTCCSRAQLSTVKIHGRMVLLRNSTPPQVMSPKGSSSTGLWSTQKNQIINEQDYIQEIGVQLLSCSQSLIHSAYDSAEALRRHPTRTSKTNNYVRCWLHHCIYGNERETEGQARAYHSERESLMINSSRNPEVSGKPDAGCCTEARSNCTTNTSLSLPKRKLDDNFFSRSHSESSQNTFFRK